MYLCADVNMVLRCMEAVERQRTFGQDCASTEVENG